MDPLNSSLVSNAVPISRLRQDTRVALSSSRQTQAPAAVGVEQQRTASSRQAHEHKITLRAARDMGMLARKNPINLG